MGATNQSTSAAIWLSHSFARLRAEPETSLAQVERQRAPPTPFHAPCMAALAHLQLPCQTCTCILPDGLNLWLGLPLVYRSSAGSHSRSTIRVGAPLIRHYSWMSLPHQSSCHWMRTATGVISSIHRVPRATASASAKRVGHRATHGATVKDRTIDTADLPRAQTPSSSKNWRAARIDFCRRESGHIFISMRLPKQCNPR